MWGLKVASPESFDERCMRARGRGARGLPAGGGSRSVVTTRGMLYGVCSKRSVARSGVKRSGYGTRSGGATPATAGGSTSGSGGRSTSASFRAARSGLPHFLRHRSARGPVAGRVHAETRDGRSHEIHVRGSANDARDGIRRRGDVYVAARPMAMLTAGNEEVRTGRLENLQGFVDARRDHRGCALSARLARAACIALRMLI